MSGVLRYLPWVFVVVGLGMLVGGGFSYHAQREFLQEAGVASGTVISNVLIPSHSYTDKKGRARVAPDAYAPQIRFTAQDNREYTFVLGRSRQTPEYAVGDHIELVYPMSQPSDALRNSFEAIWMDTCILAGMGFFFVLMGMFHGVVVPRFFGRRAESSQVA